MMSTFMAMVLLEEPFAFDASAVETALSGLPQAMQASLCRVADDGSKLSVTVDDLTCAVALFDTPALREDFARELARPDSDAVAAMVDRHKAQLVVLCRLPDVEMGQSVMAAAAVQIIAARLGALGKPLAGFWVSSSRLSDWGTFCADADTVLPAFESDGAVAFPTRYWVSVQLTREGDAIGSQTIGLAPFTGYEVDLTPIPWRMEEVAARLIGTVQYLFEAGPVLRDGETLGVSENERFKIVESPDGKQLSLNLQRTGRMKE